MESGLEHSQKRAFSLPRVAITVVVLGCVCLAVASIAKTRILEQAQRRSEQNSLTSFALESPVPIALDAKFTDADDDLVADPPKDPARRRSPDALTFAFVAGQSADEELADWKDFIAQLSTATGKPIKTVAFATTDEQLAALDEGSLHIAGFNTGVVPAAVGQAGFVPVCTFGNDDGSFGVKTQFIVPAKSPIKKLEDVKGHAITFSSRSSNSGYKAPLALLQDLDLLPGRDYDWNFSFGHDESIALVADGESQIAPVASDLLQRAIAAGAIKPEQFRVVYESERFPPATLGYAYDLSDELAAAIRTTFLDFDCRGTSLEERFNSSDTWKFVPLDYKQDYALVRRINASFREPLSKARAPID